MSDVPKMGTSVIPAIKKWLPFDLIYAVTIGRITWEDPLFDVPKIGISDIPAVKSGFCLTLYVQQLRIHSNHSLHCNVVTWFSICVTDFIYSADKESSRQKVASF